MIDYLLILVVSLLSCAGQLCQKQAASGVPRGSRRRHLLVWLSVSLLLLGLAMLAWLAVLQRLPVGRAYPMLSLNFVLVALAARWIWREALGSRQLAGIVLIVAGVALLGGGA